MLNILAMLKEFPPKVSVKEVDLKVSKILSLLNGYSLNIVESILFNVSEKIKDCPITSQKP
jgi:hypothetical protein